MAALARENPDRLVVIRTANAVRDSLGRAHYERMRAGMHPSVAIAPWEELTEPVREAWRCKIDYLMPVVCGVVAALIVGRIDRDEADAS